MNRSILLIARVIKSLPHWWRLVGALLLVSLPLYTQTLVPIAPAYSQTSVNTAIFRNNSVVSHGKWQFASFYDGDGYLTLAKRRINSEKWEIMRSQYMGNVKDGHNVISMMVDGDGYVHVAFDHHGSPLHYCRSKAPLSLELGDMEMMTGTDEGNVTYPEFYLLKGGDLLFAYRSGASGNGNLVMNRYSVKTRSWARVQDVLIDGEGKRNAYWQLFVDRAGTIHVSWVWRETWHVETNHDLCYACSHDGGKTWQKSSGERYSLPITAANAEYAWRIAQNSELINQTSMIAYDGCPYIATYWRDSDSRVPQYRLVWHDGSEWRMRQVSSRTSPFSLSGGGTKMIPIARPRLAIDGKRAYFIFRDQERGSRVSLFTTDDLANGEWRVKDLTDFSVDAWEPSFDTELWKRKRRLHIFVETTHQGDGEHTVEAKPEMAYVLEVKSEEFTSPQTSLRAMRNKLSSRGARSCHSR